MYATILYDDAAPVARLTLNRPDKRNPIGPLTCGELIHALGRVAENAAVRCVIITGAGKVFSAGGDLGQMGGPPAGAADIKPSSLVELFTAMHALGKPILAMVNGHALAGGMGLMVACDLVIASEAAEMGTTEINLGLWPMMITAEIVRSIGRKKTLELMCGGDKISAREAERLGLVNRVVHADQLEAETMAWANKLASKSPTAMRLGLRAFYDTQDMELRPALEHLQGQLGAVLGTEDAAEGIAAFFGKREPVWERQVTTFLFLLVIGSAFLHALWNALLKRQVEPELAVVGVLGASALASGVLALVLGGHPFGSTAAIGWSVAAGVLEAGYFITLGRALGRAPLGAVYTISRGGALLVVWPISVLFMGEGITAIVLCGTVLIAAGLAATGFGGAPTVEKRTTSSGLLWAAVCAMFIGGYHLCYKEALSPGTEAPAVVAVSLATAFVLNLARLGRERLARLGGQLRARPWGMIAAGVISSGSFTIFLVALKTSGAGAVLTLRNTSVLFAQGMALVIGERPERMKLVGAGLVAVGAILLGWPH